MGTVHGAWARGHEAQYHEEGIAGFFQGEWDKVAEGGGGGGEEVGGV